ncbi:MAG: hypothetical protein K2H09_04205, partial [Treponemataceae bacterium]|nr:hypothetical protein [Treponemataceae bacterium]
SGGFGSIVEYRAQDVAYYNGDSYVERFRLDADDGTYERYIGGIFMGMEFGDSFWGALYESGTYKEDERGGITFSPKKRYDWSANAVVNLGVYDRRSYYGSVTSTSLTIRDVVYERR